MLGLVYASPKAPPPGVDVGKWTRMNVTWTGANGDTFELSNWQRGVFIKKEGIEGFGMPSRDDWASPASPFVHGQEYTGFVVKPREIFLPIYLFADESSQAWHDLDARFWGTLQPGEYGTLSVETPGGVRTIGARLKEADDVFARDPFYFGWQHYGLTLIADDPFWYGGEVSQGWEQPPEQQFFHHTTGEQNFNIMPGSVLASAKMTNPGDVEAWPVWEVDGPFDSVSVGVGGRQVTYTGGAVDGQVFRMDSDPRDQTAFIDDADVTGDLGSYGFAPIPSGNSRPLNLQMVGQGTVHATIRPRFYRAWGTSRSVTLAGATQA